MKYLNLMTVLTIVFLVTNCRKPSGFIVSETRNLPDFTKIELDISSDVQITYGDDINVELTGSDNIIHLVRTYVKNDKLVIDARNLRRNDVSFNITMPKLQGIDINGSGNIDVTGDFEESVFSINISGSGNVTCTHITSDITNINIAGSGHVKCKNMNSNSFISKISGSGNIDAFGLSTNNATTKTDGSGNTKITVQDYLNVNISGSGSVFYYGNPVVDVDISGSGSVKKMQ